ncbi:MAG: hypothetical protein MI924_18595 [Chloroflexales bacterium]|nr:hypothetical protein [Chloroflexales bacterium]
MKHILTRFLLGGLLVGMLAACGQPNPANQNSSATNTPDSAATAATQTVQVETTTQPSTPEATQTVQVGMPTDSPAPGTTESSRATTTPSGASDPAAPAGTSVARTTVAPITPTTVVLQPAVSPAPLLQESPAPPTAAAVLGEVPADLMAKIIDDLADRTGAERSAIVTVASEFTTWNDGSLGCPQPGMEYTQAQVDGYRVVLRVGATEYDYRSSTRGFFFLCSPQSASTQPTTRAPADQFLIYSVDESDLVSDTQPATQHKDRAEQASIEHLAARLGVGAETILVVSTREAELQSAAPCGTTVADESGALGDGLRMGYEVVLQVDNTQYRYVALAALGYYCGVR